MSLNHSPSVVTNGLVMYYDTSNTQKSWKGAPTTNITPDLGIVQVQSVSCTYVGVEDGWKKYALGGTWTAGGYPYGFAVDGFTCTGGVTYSTGIYIKTNVPTKFASLFSGMNYVNAPMNDAGTSFSIPQSDGSIFVGRYGFQYTSTSGQNGYLLSQPVINQAFNSATDFIYIKNGQIEQNSFCTPFVAGTRSNTQAIVDLTGNNTLTASSLTYASDSTFSFNGSSDYITVADSTILTNTTTLTISVWFKSSAAAGTMQPLVGKGTSDADEEYCLLAGGGSIYFDVGQGAGPYTSPLYSFSNNTWYNVVGVHTRTAGSSVLTVYLNGVALSSSTITPSNTPNDNSYPVSIGRRFYNSGTPANGSIPAVSIYNRALSAAEVAQNFNALRGRYGI